MREKVGGRGDRRGLLLAVARNAPDPPLVDGLPRNPEQASQLGLAEGERRLDLVEQGGKREGCDGHATILAQAIRKRKPFATRPAGRPPWEEAGLPARSPHGKRLSAGGREGSAVDDRDGERLAALGAGAQPRPGVMLVARRAAVLALEPDEPPHLARSRGSRHARRRSFGGELHGESFALGVARAYGPVSSLAKARLYAR